MHVVVEVDYETKEGKQIRHPKPILDSTVKKTKIKIKLHERLSSYR
jgi:hypothetical protein